MPQLKTTLIMAVAFFWISCPIDTNAQSKNDLEFFRNSTHYTRGLVGFAGHQFEADIIFENILATKDAESIFLQTIRSPKSSPASIAYSFCGLKKLGSKELNEIKKSLMQSNKKVSLMHGDIMKKEILSNLITSIYQYGC